MKISFVSYYQYEILIELGDEVFDLIDTCINEDETIDFALFNKAYGRFWLWVLGSYEFIRTLDQNSNCFPQVYKSVISELKKELSLIRMPFAKQEYRGEKNSKAESATLVSDVDVKEKDIFFQIKEVKLSAKGLINRFYNEMSRL